MKKFYSITLLILLAFLILITPSVIYSQGDTSLSTLDNKLDKPVRLGYCQSQKWFEFDGILYYTAKALVDLGWIDNLKDYDYKMFQEDAQSLWNYLSDNCSNENIIFVKDAFYDASLDPNIEATITTRLNGSDDIDIMLSLGTYAGMVTANHKHDTPVLIFGTSNPVQSNLVKAFDYSGYENIFAHTDPERYTRQLEVFYDIFEFQSVGIVYEDSFRKVFAAVDDVKKVASEKGFKVVEKTVWGPSDVNDPKEFERYYNDLKSAYRELANEVDVFYMTNGAWSFDRLPELLEPFYEKKIPVFSQVGSIEVKYGAMMSLAQADFSGLGYFAADVLLKTAKGEKPGEIPQQYADMAGIAFNLEATNLVGYKIPFEILLVSDEIYLKLKPE